MAKRTVLVTGGTGALGTSVTRRFLADGHDVAVSWIVESQADELLSELGDSENLFLVEMDATSSEDVARAIGEIDERFGGIDVLAHLVGMWKGGTPLAEVDDRTWDLVMDVNLRSAFNLARGVMPGMLQRDWGRLIFVSSRTAHQDRAGQIPYAISKAAVAALAESIAEETRGTNVTANTVAPSVIDTEANRKSFPKADHSAWVSPDEIAANISFLATEEAGELRGAWLPVYGSA